MIGVWRGCGGVHVGIAGYKHQMNKKMNKKFQTNVLSRIKIAEYINNKNQELRIKNQELKIVSKKKAEIRLSVIQIDTNTCCNLHRALKKFLSYNLISNL